MSQNQNLKQQGTEKPMGTVSPLAEAHLVWAAAQNEGSPFLLLPPLGSLRTGLTQPNQGMDPAENKPLFFCQVADCLLAQLTIPPCRHLRCHHKEGTIHGLEASTGPTPFNMSLNLNMIWITVKLQPQCRDKWDSCSKESLMDNNGKLLSHPNLSLIHCILFQLLVPSLCCCQGPSDFTTESTYNPKQS